MEASSNSRENGGVQCTCPSELILTHRVSLAPRQNTKSLPFSCFSLGKLLLRSKLSRLLSSQWKKEIRSGQRVFVWSVCGLYLVFARSLHGLCAIFPWIFCGLWKLLYDFWFASGCIIDICSLIFSLFSRIQQTVLLHFVAFFHVASLLSTGVDNEKVGVDNEKF